MPPEIALRLDGDHFAHGLGVVDEVEPVARPDLDHPPGEAGQELAPVLSLATILGLRPEAGVEPGEERVMDVCRLLWHAISSDRCQAGLPASSWKASGRPGR